MAYEPEDIDEEAVRKGRLMLWIALVGAIVSVPAMIGDKPAIFMTAWVASFFGGLGGIREVARATGGSAVLMYGAFVMLFMPILNLVVIGAYLLIARSALQGETQAAPPRRAPTPAPARPVANPAPGARAQSGPPPKTAAQLAAFAVQPARTHVLSGAIAQIKVSGLRGEDGREMPDGKALAMKPTMPEGMAQLAPEDWPILRVTGIFGVVYLLDEGSHYALATTGQLDRAGITLDELHRIGLENLRGKARDLVVAEGDGAHMLTMGGDFEASMLLVDSLWEPGGVLAGYVPNGPVATIPARDLCVFCDARSPQGLRRVNTFAMTASVEKQSQQLTRKVLARRDGRWRELAAADPRDAPLQFK